MHSVATFVSVLCLATSALAQYGDYETDSGSSSSNYSPAPDTSGSENGSAPAEAVPEAAVTSSSPPANSPQSDGSVTTHVIKVSNKNGDLKFEPNNLQAEAGHVVQFQFWPKVDLSSFSVPTQLYLTKTLEPLRRSIHIRPALCTHQQRQLFHPGLLLWIHAGPGRRNHATNLLDRGQRHQTHLVLLLARGTLPGRYGGSDQSVSFTLSFAHMPCQYAYIPRNRPAQNKSRTIESFTELAAEAPDNVSPSVGQTPGETDGTTPAGTTGTPPSGTNTAAVANFTGAANSLVGGQWTLTSLGMAGVLGLYITCL
jgi:hypothetical protein